MAGSITFTMYAAEFPRFREALQEYAAAATDYGDYLTRCALIADTGCGPAPAFREQLAPRYGKRPDEAISSAARDPGDRGTARGTGRLRTGA